MTVVDTLFLRYGRWCETRDSTSTLLLYDYLTIRFDLSALQFAYHLFRPFLSTICVPFPSTLPLHHFRTVVFWHFRWSLVYDPALAQIYSRLATLKLIRLDGNARLQFSASQLTSHWLTALSSDQHFSRLSASLPSFNCLYVAPRLPCSTAPFLPRFKPCRRHVS